MSEEKKVVPRGETIDFKTKEHPGYGSGSGGVDTTTYKCPCGKGTLVHECDDIPGFRDNYYTLNCSECLEKYDLDFRTGKITEK